jgi:hypothetical protein
MRTYSHDFEGNERLRKSIYGEKNDIAGLLYALNGFSRQYEA